MRTAKDVIPGYEEFLGGLIEALEPEWEREQERRFEGAALMSVIIPIWMEESPDAVRLCMKRVT